MRQTNLSFYRIGPNFRRSVRSNLKRYTGTMVEFCIRDSLAKFKFAVRVANGYIIQLNGSRGLCMEFGTMCTLYSLKYANGSTVRLKS